MSQLTRAEVERWLQWDSDGDYNALSEAMFLNAREILEDLLAAWDALEAARATAHRQFRHYDGRPIDQCDNQGCQAMTAALPERSEADE